MKDWIRAIRAYQWSKNVLIFVPLLTSFRFADPQAVSHSIVAFLAFSAVASANYLVNDILDRSHDREHPTKRNRPIAAGAISVRAAAAGSAVLCIAGVAASWTLGSAFVLTVAGYLALTILYTLRLKRVVIVDVVTLACLYTIRIVAGAVAIAVNLSSWLLAFSVFLFLSLALVKRCAELVVMENAGRTGTAGRGYMVSDLRVLWPLGTGAALCSVVIFGLFVSAPDTQARYASPNVIWLAGIGLIYWLARLWVKTSRGEMHDDPIVFTAKDRTSLLVIGFMIATAIVAYAVRVW